MVEELHFDMDAEELEIFCLESDELTEQLDADLLAVEQGETAPEVIQRLFRAAHTLKGSAGAIGHHRMASLTHSMEAVLELLRQSHIQISPDLIDTLLRSVDMLRLMVQEVSTQAHSGVEPDELIERLAALSAAASASTGDAWASGTGPEARAETNGVPLTPESPSNTLEVQVEIAADSAAPAARALQVLMALDECGQVLSSAPDRGAIEWGDPCHRVGVLVASACDIDDIRGHLAHIGELVGIEIRSKDGPGRAANELTNGTGVARSARVGGNSLKTVRTSVERLDKLMNLVGELVTDRNRLLQTHRSLSAEFGDAAFLDVLAEAITHLASITDELQQEVMRARMLPLEHVFSKFPRVVRDLARDAGKDVVLEIEGQETELDRSVIEEIADPLLHLLRNAVDHGIEMPEERVRAGKPETGVVRLGGRSEGDRIIITVAEDGRGIDAERVRQTAVERGFLSAEAAQRLARSEALELIFLPGLSTATKVTDISGRGVGMDVVRENVERLHGSIAVHSVLGQGTTFELSLPLTLAIMPVLLVSLDGATYCIPLTNVVEALEVAPLAIHQVDGGEVILWRDRILPLVRLRRFFHLDHLDEDGDGMGGGVVPHENSTQAVIAVRNGDDYAGLVVDQLLGRQEIVIKSLGHMIGEVPGISGGTILGDGSVALIVDVPGLTKRSSPSGPDQAIRSAQVDLEGHVYAATGTR